MAQIKKFQSGGKMFIDGHEIDLEDYYKYASSLTGQARTAAMDMYNSAKTGKTVNYDSGRNTATGVTWSDINQAGLDNADKGKGWTRAKARRQAFWGGKGDDFVRALQAAGRYTIPESPKPEETTPESLFKSNQSFDYNEIKGEDGKISKVWSNSLGNADQLAYFNSIRDAVFNWDEENYKTKYTAEDLDKLRNIKAKYDLDEDFFTNLETGFKGGNFDNQELWDNLRYMGFINPNDTARQTIGQQDTNDPWSGWKNPFSGTVSDDVLKGRGARIYTGKDGNLYWDDYKDDDNVYLLNDPTFDYLGNTTYRNGAMYKGRLFTQDQIKNGTDSVATELRNLVNERRAKTGQLDGFDAWLNSELDASNRFRYQGRGQRGGFRKFDTSKSYFKEWDKDFANGDYDVVDVGVNLSGLPDGTKVIGYIDYKNGGYDFYGNPNLYYKVKNKDGNIVTINSSEFQRWKRDNNVSESKMTQSGDLDIVDLSDDGLGFYNDRTLNVDVDGIMKQIWFQRDRNGNIRYYGLGKRPVSVNENSHLWRAVLNGDTLTKQQVEWLNNNKPTSDPNYKFSGYGNGFISKNKTGGRLPKFQWGGAIANSYSNKQNEDYFEPENIMQTPGHIGSNDMTSADRWEMGAIAADLASILSSFTNASGAGAIVTGVTGLGGTAAQLVADAKRDGLDWGDIGRAGIGLGFDVVGMLPGLGTAGKVGKLGKNIAKASGTIGKAINYATKAGMAIGTISAATQTYDKIKSGEKLNVDDYRNLLTLFTGLGYGTRGAVNAGRASKAASEIGSKMAKNADGTITLKSLGTLKDAKDIKLSKSDAATLEKMMGKKDAAEKIQNFLKSKTDVTVEEADLPKILDNYGFDSKSKWFGAKKYIDNEEFVKGKKVLDESETEHGTGYYFLHGNRRNAVLDQAKNKGLLKELYANGEGLSHRTRTYLGNRSVWDPESVGMSWDDKIQNNWFADFVPRTYKRVRKNISIPTTSTISANPTLPLPFVIGRQSSLTNIPFKSIYPAPSTLLPSLQTTPKSIPTSTSKFTPKREAERKIFREIITDLKNIKSSDDLRQFLLKVGFNGHGYDGESVDNPYREILNKYPRFKQQLIKHIDNDRWFHGSGIDDFVYKYNLKFEKGGKIVKAAVGTYISMYPHKPLGSPKTLADTTFGDQSSPKPVGSIMNQSELDLMRITNQLTKPTFEKQLQQNVRWANRNARQQNRDIRRQDQDAKQQNDSHLPGKKLGEFNWNKLKDVGLSTGRLLTSIGMNNAQHKAMEKSIRAGMGALEQMPTETYNRFQDNGITAAYNAKANQERMVKPVSSDYLKNAALEQMAKSQADNTELEGKLRLAEQYQQYHQEQNNLRRQYAQQRNEIANRNNAKMAAMNSALAQNDASKITNNFQSLNNFGMELQNKNDQFAQENRAFDRQVAQMQWMNKQNPNSKMTNADIINMMKPLDPRNTNGWFINRAQYAKKGTKLRSRLDADEQIWVNQNKAAAEAVKKINDNIIKLIMKALS